MHYCVSKPIFNTTFLFCANVEQGCRFLSQLYPYSEEAGVLISTRRQNGFVASLADIGWIDREEDEDNEDFISGSRWESHSALYTL